MTDAKIGSYYTALPSIANDYYWSSTVSADNTKDAWNGLFTNGTMYTNTKTFSVTDL